MSFLARRREDSDHPGVTHPLLYSLQLTSPKHNVCAQIRFQQFLLAILELGAITLSGFYPSERKYLCVV